MKEFALEQGLLKNPRRNLIGSYLLKTYYSHLLFHSGI